jgi:hypothetical protein
MMREKRDSDLGLLSFIFLLLPCYFSGSHLLPGVLKQMDLPRLCSSRRFVTLNPDSLLERKLGSPGPIQFFFLSRFST